MICKSRSKAACLGLFFLNWTVLSQARQEWAGGGQHSTRDSLTGDFLSFNSEKNEGFFFMLSSRWGGGGSRGRTSTRSDRVLQRCKEQRGGLEKHGPSQSAYRWPVSSNCLKTSHDPVPRFAPQITASTFSPRKGGRKGRGRGRENVTQCVGTRAQALLDSWLTFILFVQQYLENSAQHSSCREPQQ